MYAKLSYLHIAPRKVRIVASLLRGMDTKRAELELHHLPKRASAPLAKLLKSAVQNAANMQQDVDRLYIRHIAVDAGPMMKRMMPRAFGRAATIRKRMSHVSIELGVRGEENSVVRTAKKAAIQNIREVKWEEVKGEVDSDSSPSRSVSTAPIKKTKGFGKKIFTRKVI